MKTIRNVVLIILGMGLFLGNSCYLQPATLDCSSVKLQLTVTAGSSTPFRNVCVDDLWVLGDTFQFLEGTNGVSIKTVVDPSSITRYVVTAPNLQPTLPGLPMVLNYDYERGGEFGNGQMELTVVTGLTANATGTPPVINPGQSAALQVTAAGGAPPYSYQWVPNAGLSDATIAQPTASPSTTVIYTATVTDTAGLTASASVTVTVNLQVSATATPSTINVGQLSRLLVQAQGGSAPYTYSWAPGASLDDSSLPAPLASPTTTTTYTVTVTDAAGHTGTSLATVTVGVSLPPPVITNVLPRCPSTSQGTCGPTAGGSPQVSISGNNFQPGAAVRFGVNPAEAIVTPPSLIDATPPPGTAGAADITVTNPDGQSATFTNGYTYIAPLVLAVTATPPVVAANGTSQLQASPTGNPPFTFQWTSDPALSSLTIANPVATPSNPPVCCGSVARTSVYNVTVTDSSQQRASGSVTVTTAGPALQAGFDRYQAAGPIFRNSGVTFDAGRSAGPNPIVLFEWWQNWNPAAPTPPDLSGPFLVRPTFFYSNSGNTTVRLRVTDSLGSTAVTTLGISVE